MPGDSRRAARYARLLESYLVAIGKGLEYHVRTGETVRRNQFDPHRLFSPPETED